MYVFYRAVDCGIDEDISRRKGRDDEEHWDMLLLVGNWLANLSSFSTVLFYASV